MQSFRIFFLLGLLVVSLDTAAWWNADWGYRKAITIDTSAAQAAVSEDLTDIPVLVRLHTGNFAHFLDLTEGGGDIRFVAGDDKTPLQHHVEKIDVVNELAFIWVKVPLVRGGRGPDSRVVAVGEGTADAEFENKFYMYFGNPTALGGTGSGATYSPAYAMVYHMDDAGGAPLDRSANALAVLTASGLVSSPSLIGDGIRFAGGGTLTVADAPELALDPVRGGGISVWLRIDAPQTDAHVIERKSGGQLLLMGLDGTALTLRYEDGAGATHSVPATQLMLGTWHHLAVGAQGGKWTLFVDGEEAGGFEAPSEALAGPLTVGAAADGGHGFEGELDELRLHASVPTAGLLRFEAASEGADGVGIIYLADESMDAEGGGEVAGEHSSYFGIILNQVFGNDQAIIEQGVILICALMGLVAIVVMGLKQTYLRTCRLDSEKFLHAYEALELDAGKGMEALSDGDSAYLNSPLYRIYRQGIREIERRRGAQGTINLDDRSLMSIRAALDAVMVREGQKLNSRMVLLTIAISGGPFIGLLGTVVGVMVTFAAIAATGDVNINAIAPGMAAALLATTAGLGVAIPALFGYNYLGSQVKEVAADMHVYADEFLARLNELYGRGGR